MSLRISILLAAVLTIGCGQSPDNPPTSANNSPSNENVESYNSVEPTADSNTTLVSFNVPGMT